MEDKKALRTKDQIVLDQILNDQNSEQKHNEKEINWRLWDGEELTDLLINNPDKKNLRLHILKECFIRDVKQLAVILVFYSLKCHETFNLILVQWSGKEISENIVMPLYIARTIIFDNNSHELLRDARSIIKNDNLSENNFALLKGYEKKYADREKIIDKRICSTFSSSGGIH